MFKGRFREVYWCFGGGAGRFGYCKRFFLEAVICCAVVGFYKNGLLGFLLCL